MNQISNITPEELSAELAAKPGIIVLDVRGAEERQISGLPNDLHIPMGEVLSRVDELDKRYDQVLANGYATRSRVRGHKQ